MNSIMREQSSNTVFTCAFCRYQSQLDLRECPGCGRVKRVSDPKVIQLGEVFGAQPQNRKNTNSKMPQAFPLQEPKNYYYECERCHYRKPKHLRECPECGRIGSAKKVFLAPESSADKANNQNLEKRKRAIEAASPLIFENSHVFNAVMYSILVIFCGAFVIQTSLFIILLYLVGISMLILLCLISYCMHVAVNKDGIAQKKLFGGWEVSWSEITGWNEIALGEGVTSICFRTETDIYKISGDILSNPWRFELVKQRFEWHCGEPLEGPNRIGGI